MEVALIAVLGFLCGLLCGRLLHTVAPIERVMVGDQYIDPAIWKQPDPSKRYVVGFDLAKDQAPEPKPIPDDDQMCHFTDPETGMTLFTTVKEAKRKREQWAREQDEQERQYIDNYVDGLPTIFEPGLLDADNRTRD